MANPFRFRELGPDDPFCNREEEQRKLTSSADGKANVVIFSPRRYGKTSLVKRVQTRLAEKGFITIYVDFFGVSSVDEVAYRLARNVYRSLHERESLLKKGKRFLKTFKSFRPVFRASDSGLEITVEASSHTLDPMRLLESIMEELGDFAAKEKAPVNAVFDEFQEITRLKESSETEGILRSHIQGQKISYFFVGSRRGVLLAMFNDRKRPFFQSAVMLPLGPLKDEDTVPFLVEQFARGKKRCSEKAARQILKTVDNHPYYIQRLAFEVYELAGKNVKKEDVEKGLQNVIQSEKFGYEAIIQGMSSSDIKLVKAIAKEPCSAIFSSAFASRTGLAIATIQHAKRKLVEKDLIERDNDGTWKLVDPLFAIWLTLL